MGEKWAITGEGISLQRPFRHSVERFCCIMLTLEHVIVLENTCKINKNITVEEFELWYHMCVIKKALLGVKRYQVWCAHVPHDKVLWGYSGKMQDCRMVVPEASPATN